MTYSDLKIVINEAYAKFSEAYYKRQLLGADERYSRREVYFVKTLWKILMNQQGCDLLDILTKANIQNIIELFNKYSNSLVPIEYVNCEGVEVILPSDLYPLQDYDGNEYDVITVGGQEWIVQNLKTTHYADGSVIPNLVTDESWVGTVEEIVINYGYLYNWYTIDDSRNICPEGWHIPSDDEWTILRTTAGDVNAGYHLREIGMDHWQDSDPNVDNSTGFSLFGSGYKISGPLFHDIKGVIILFSSTDAGSDASVWWSPGNNQFEQPGGGFAKNWGASIRLIKDDSTDPGTVTGNDERVYNTVKIGDQVWTVQNLVETKYRNGDLIPEVTTSWYALTSGVRCSYNNDESNALTVTPAVLPGDGYCWYDNDITNKDLYGALYNWYAVDDASELVYFKRNGVQETGWRIPTNDDINLLILRMGGDDVAGGKLKEVGTTNWTTPNTGATDEIGFKALPAGVRSATSGVFSNLTLSTQLWTEDIWDFSFSYDSEAYAITDVSAFESSGFSVRCVKDVNLTEGMGKYTKLINLDAGDTTEITTPITTEPYNVFLLDSDGNDITSAVTIAVDLVDDVYVISIYSVDALTNVRLKLLY
jgi:uncharacterized protein (TIGR02145 family)